MKDLTKLEQKQLRHLMQERKERLRLEREEESDEDLNAEVEDVSLRESLIRQIAKNVSQLVIVGSFEAPQLDLPTLDRLLILAELEELETVLCLNKIDLLQNRGEGERIARLYRKLNYAVLLTSARTGEGFAEFRHKLEQKHSVLAGACGVGKTALLRALDPAYEQKQSVRRLALTTGAGENFSCTIHDYKLTHATEVTEVNGVDLHELVCVPHDEVQRYFAEFREPSRDCAEEGCLHIHEEDCGVMQAVAEGKIAKARHASYLQVVKGMRAR
jgi:ribosome biogenesis GTPase